MSRGASISRILSREALLALLVLALVFLNFGHRPASAAEGYAAGWADTSWCGEPSAPSDAGHAPCHACRIGEGAALPPPPACIEPVAFATSDVIYTDADAILFAPLPILLAQPRAPPAV